MITENIELREALPYVAGNTLPGPKAEAILNRRKEAVPNAVRSVYPLVINRGEGAMIEDVDGNRFLDWVGGVGVLNVGYSQVGMIEAVQEQAGKFFHAMMNVTTHEPYIELAERLNQIVPVRGDHKKTMLANSGAEAVENAIKIAKAATKRPNIIVFTGAFHGRTALTMTMTAKKAYAHGMGPFPDGIYRSEYPYLYRSPKGYSESEAIDYYIGKLKEMFIHASPAEYVAAIVLEPIQGEGGFVPAPFEWVKAVRAICDEYGILLIADEVQTGFARSGKLFVSSYWAEFDCEPDIMTMAKSIAAGMPLGAITTRRELMDAVPVGVIGGTYSGNPLACVSALKVIDFIEKENLCDRALEISEICLSSFKAWKEEFEIVGDVRGIGTMLGIELVKDKVSKEPYPEMVASLVQECLKEGLIIEPAGTYGNVIRFLCPLVVTNEQLNKGLEILEAMIRRLTILD